MALNERVPDPAAEVIGHRLLLQKSPVYFTTVLSPSITDALVLKRRKLLRNNKHVRRSSKIKKPTEVKPNGF